MKPITDFKTYHVSFYRLFGKFPILLLVICLVGAYAVGLFLGRADSASLTAAMGASGISQAFFRGAVATVLLFYVARFTADSALKKAYNAEAREEDGYFIPCMSHKNMLDMSYGNLIIKRDRFYFEPSRPFAGDLTFDYPSTKGLEAVLGIPKESVGLFLLTGESHMLVFRTPEGEIKGRFVIPEPKVYIEQIQGMMAEYQAK